MNTYAIDGLKTKLAETQSAIRANRAQLKALLADRGTLLAALRLFEDQERPEGAAFGSGEFSRTILDTIRKAAAPMCARDIAEALTVGQTLSKQEFGGVLARVRNGLTRLSDKLEGELRDRTTYWQVKD